MEMPKVFGADIYYRDKLDLYFKGIGLYVFLMSLKDKNRALSNRPLEILTYYVLEGYNPKTKKFLMKTLNISDKNLSTVNLKLTKLGYLVQDNLNFQNKKISNDLVSLKKYLESGVFHSTYFLAKFSYNEKGSNDN